MSGLNQMGPDNMGPMTGRRMGRCGNGDTQNQNYPGQAYGRGYGYVAGDGRGRGCGRGVGPRGRGFGSWAAPAVSPAPMTKGSLDLRAKALEQELEAVRNELKNLSDE